MGEERSTRSTMKGEVPIRFGDVDKFGHFNHTRVLVLCGEHRTKMFTEIEADIGERRDEFGLVVAGVEADYKQPIGAGARIADVDVALIG